MTWHKDDKIITAFVDALAPPEPRMREDLYLALLDSVMGQQLSTKAADAIFARFCALFPKNYPEAKKLLKMPEEKLRGAGLSGAKVKYAKNIAAFHLEFPITNEHLAHLSDEEILEKLTRIKGVGSWTVHMLLMFAMGRPDVFSPGDLVIRQMMVEHYGIEETGRAQLARLHEIAETWRPNRTMACRYLWNARDAAKKIKK
ncbi:MAG: DNA-3-methyladenine glycosylase 2 family protein [Alphaproteobacteria bacterium]|nr:DNA-3-methyladenine glycosylase 2 family protein [Alphaproteobacteria bacterium]